MRVISTERVPIKMWLPYLEDGAEKQAKNLANLPFIFKHVAIMPDSHQGYGCPIGGVLVTKGFVVPNCVGVDIGCGMCALNTGINEMDKGTLKTIMGLVRQKIPVGKQHQPEPQSMNYMPQDINDCGTVIRQEYGPARGQVGTLGGGNHFIEIQRDTEGFIWIMIHSGSRNIGKKVADYYNEQAKKLNQKWCSTVPPSADLAFLPLDGEGQAYLRDMNFCVEFAFANRRLMMQRVVEAFDEAMGVGVIDNQPSRVNDASDMINIAHNYAAMENHYGENVMVHRKGATRARLGEIGIIPGSQGTKSYIVRGKGNKESFESCSHGAGRQLSRMKARATINLEAEIAALDAAGVVHSIRSQKDLDEAPSAYKNIDEVMANQADLVEILVELTPLGVIKG